MKNWQPVSHFGVKVLATYCLGFIATCLGMVVITLQFNLTDNRSDNVMMLCFAVVLLALSHWWLHLPLFKRPQHVRHAFVIVLMMIALNAIDLDWHWGQFSTALIGGLCIGFVEETMCRGPILFWLWTKTPRHISLYWWTAITSGTAFGLLHLSNYQINPDWTQILIQVRYTSVMGVAAAGLFMYTHNLSFTILMHAGFDTLAGLSGYSNSHLGANFQDVASLLLMVVVDLAIGIWLMKQLSRENHDLPC